MVAPRRASCLAAVLALLGLALPSAARTDRGVVQAIRFHVDDLRRTGSLGLGDDPIAAAGVLPALYEHRAFQPAWLAPGRADAVLRALLASRADGLDPEDYHLSALRSIRERLSAAASSSPISLARYDMLMSDAVARLVYHLEFGRVDPVALDPNWNLTRKIGALDPVAILERIIRAESVEAAIHLHRPQNLIYERALAGLAHYQAIHAAGGWQPVPEGPALEPGAEGERVLALRRRLAATGDLTPAVAATVGAEVAAFDARLEEAVATFQTRHHLERDGVAAGDTLDALNVPVEARIDQLRVNLERARWALRDLPSEYVLVDIAGFETSLVRDGETIWHARAVVGQPFRRTPVFRSEIRYMDFNPTWTIPPGILEKDTLPHLQRDPGYLGKRHIRLFGADGSELDPLSVDWTRYGGGALPPYRFVQDPGPKNSLGRVKFTFPNPHLVYLHDTPSRSLFDETERAQSSGCIRIERPLELAELLLDDPERWDAAGIQELVDSGETRTVFLPQRVPVILMYWTIDVHDEARIGFRHDLYERDAAVLAALTGDFEGRVAPPEAIGADTSTPPLRVGAGSPAER